MLFHILNIDKSPKMSVAAGWIDLLVERPVVWKARIFIFYFNRKA